jgi:D-aminoacyl-tRNA deacylase
MLSREGDHIYDEALDRRLPAELRANSITIVFPSIHRSAEGVECLTVHPIGNLGPSSDLGGRPRSLVPTNPQLMTTALRRLAEGAGPMGTPATFEATHHGPLLTTPAFFAEIGYGASDGPPEESVKLLASVLRELEPSHDDHIALGVGGGHYVPHFTQLALHRRWAFGHLIPRHSLEHLDAVTARDALGKTPGAEGILYARAADATHPFLSGLAKRLRDGEAPLLPEEGTGASPTRAARPSGT